MWEYLRLDWHSGINGYYPGTSTPQSWSVEGGGTIWFGMMDALRDLGNEGWEAVSIVALPSALPGQWMSQYILLKREKRDDVQGHPDRPAA